MEFPPTLVTSRTKTHEDTQTIAWALIFPGGAATMRPPGEHVM